MLKTLTRVPLSEAVAKSLPSKESAKHARAVEWAWTKRVRRTSYSSMRTCIIFYIIERQTFCCGDGSMDVFSAPPQVPHDPLSYLFVLEQSLQDQGGSLAVYMP